MLADFFQCRHRLEDKGDWGGLFACHAAYGPSPLLHGTLISQLLRHCTTIAVSLALNRLLLKCSCSLNNAFKLGCIKLIALPFKCSCSVNVRCIKLIAL